MQVKHKLDILIQMQIQIINRNACFNLPGSSMTFTARTWVLYPLDDENCEKALDFHCYS